MIPWEYNFRTFSEKGEFRVKPERDIILLRLKKSILGKLDSEKRTRLFCNRGRKIAEVSEVAKSKGRVVRNDMGELNRGENKGSAL